MSRGDAIRCLSVCAHRNHDLCTRKVERTALDLVVSELARQWSPSEYAFFGVEIHWIVSAILACPLDQNEVAQHRRHLNINRYYTKQIVTGALYLNLAVDRSPFADWL